MIYSFEEVRELLFAKVSLSSTYAYFADIPSFIYYSFIDTSTPNSFLILFWIELVLLLTLRLLLGVVLRFREILVGVFVLIEVTVLN